MIITITIIEINPFKVSVADLVVSVPVRSGSVPKSVGWQL